MQVFSIGDNLHELQILFSGKSKKVSHYENKPIQMYRKFHLQELKIFTKISISAQNIECGYSLEPPRRGGFYEFPLSMFWAEIRKIMHTTVNPGFNN